MMENEKGLFGEDVNVAQPMPKGMWEAGIRNSENQLNKLYWMRLIVAVAVRLSLIASVWLVVFDPTKWYAVILFVLLTFLIGGVQDQERKITKTDS